METIRTTCSYCSVGCNFNAVLEGKQLKSFLPAREYPVNLGKSCPKGFHLLKALDVPDRATQPQLRDDAGAFAPVTWDRALDVFVQRFKGIKERHGDESVAFLSTGQMPTEEMALLGSLFKFGMGFVHADGNTRQCMATAAVAYKQAFGFDAPPLSYKDLELSDLLVFVGANPVIAHPIIWNRVKMNARGRQIVVIDPRKTKTADEAAVHIAVNPKADLDLLYAVAHVLIANDWIDHRFIKESTEGYEEFALHVKGFSPQAVETRTGVASAAIMDLAERIHKAEAVSFWWTMGVNQSHQGVRTAQAIINLALITGNIGRPGTGPNSITGQANAMGSRLFSNTTSLLGGRDFLKEEDRRTVSKILGIDAARIPGKNSLPYHKIIEEAKAGRIRGLWIIATNPAHSWIDKSSLLAILDKLEFLVVQDLYPDTETAQRAHLILPAAGSGEKNGTLINSERRFGIVDKIMDPPGEARSDFEIFRAIAGKWGCADMFAEWSSPEAAFRIIQRLSEGTPCDFSGIDGYAMLRGRGGVQWPYPRQGSSDEGERRLFSDRRFYTATGKAKMLFEQPRPPAEQPDKEYPLILLSGRGTVVQWHTQTRTGRVAMLNQLRPARCYVQINPQDASSLGIAAGDRVEVSSRRGSVVVDATVTAEVRVGEVFMPMHYEETNFLTYPEFDTYSSEPSYKYAAVRVRRQQ